MLNKNFNNFYYFNKKIEKKFFLKFKKLFKNNEFIGTKYEEKFEKDFAKYNKSKYCVSCSNGSDGLILALKTLNLKKDQEVIVPNHTWISTATSVTSLGGKIRFCDTKRDDFTIDENKIKNLINNKTVGIIAVHLFGYPCNIDIIKKICKTNKLWLIEDCAQSHFSKFNSVNVGNFGDISVFSFFPSKNLGSIGDAGALITNNNKIRIKLKKLRNHGASNSNDFEELGMNSRMNAIHALFLTLKLKEMKSYAYQKQKLANQYLESLKKISSIELPIIDRNKVHTWHHFVIKCKNRDKLKSYLKSKSIVTSIHYPKMLSNTKIYRTTRNKKDLKSSLKYEEEILSLPINPFYTTKKTVNLISKNIKIFYGL